MFEMTILQLRGCVGREKCGECLADKASVLNVLKCSIHSREVSASFP